MSVWFSFKGAVSWVVTGIHFFSFLAKTPPKGDSFNSISEELGALPLNGKFQFEAKGIRGKEAGLVIHVNAK